MFKQIPTPLQVSNQEKEILDYWKKENIFAQSLQCNKGQKEFVFYDGPPFATGLPHYGHLLAGTIKDVIPRYQTMIGKYVDRVFGWDCHGLPVENEVEKELGIGSKSEIESRGIAMFNENCRSIVLRYTSEWENIVHRMGRWVDFNRGYRTMDRSYMESIWWVFHQLWDKGLIYQGYKVLPYCPRCATPLSNFETNQDYQEVDDPSITIRCNVKGKAGQYFLVWTTTPWTLTSNQALAVGSDIQYALIDDQGSQYILACDRLSAYYKEESPKINKIILGKELAGMEYEPVFPYVKKAQGNDISFKVVTADFVSTQEGTGIVHIAPGFGEEDAAVGKNNGLSPFCPIDAECSFTHEVEEYEHRFVKDCDKDIILRLKQESSMLHRGTIRHNYPHCWRCESPLIYRSVSTWFVRVESMRERLLQANEDINWMPKHIKHGRFGNWLKNAHDWAISRNRYWGCPLPIWRNAETGETVCIGSITELEERSGKRIDDIHKHFIDDISIPAKTPGEHLTRIPEVLDCWFESGAMPYAQKHYPFENKDWLEAHFPADFIAEGLDQTRGWFYTLLVIGGALFKKPAFKNVIVNGLILAEDGRKMSKRLKNYPDPAHIMDTYGADALRFYLLSSPVLRGENLRFSEKGVKDVLRSVILPLWNAYSFLVTYARVDNWYPQQSLEDLSQTLTHPLDRWIIGKVSQATVSIRSSMNAYDIQKATSVLPEVIDQLTNWYIRRSRRRFWKSDDDQDKLDAFHSLYYVLLTLCQTAAPFIPFITEAIYRNLRRSSDPDSVHLCQFPTLPEAFVDDSLERTMGRIIKAVFLGRSLRSQAGIKLRQPLASVSLVSMHQEVRQDLIDGRDVIREELNVKEVIIEESEEAFVHLHAKANFRKLGPKFGKQMKQIASAIEKMGYPEIMALQKGNRYSLSLKGEAVEIDASDIEISRQEKPGIAVANEGDITLALDITLDKNLEMEGKAREIINRLQNLRKEMKFDVADRINISYRVPSILEEVIQVHQKYIKGETLAESLSPDPELTEHKVDIEGSDCYFSLAVISK